MELTRVDTNALRIAVHEARAALAKVRELLAPPLVIDLTDAERAEVLRAPVRVLDAARDLALLAKQRPELLAVAGYDPEAVMEDIENLAALSGMSETLAELQRWVDDSKLVWSAEVYQQSLTLHGVAKALAKTDGSLRPLVDPLSEVFAARRRASGSRSAPRTNPE
ncbi:MAG: hypothetical protein ABMB14_40800 [Myxococcota bacterium]